MRSIYITGLPCSGLVGVNVYCSKEFADTMQRLKFLKQSRLSYVQDPDGVVSGDGTYWIWLRHG